MTVEPVLLPWSRARRMAEVALVPVSAVALGWGALRGESVWVIADLCWILALLGLTRR